MSDLDLVAVLAGTDPAGPSQAADTTLTRVVAVYAVDADGARVQVGMFGSVLWLPAQPGRYTVRAPDLSTSLGRARVLLDPTSSRPVLVLGPVDPRASVVAATLTGSTSTTCTVTLDGSTYTLPYLAGSYGTPPRAVWVSLDDWGRPVLVLGPSAVADQSTTAPTAPAGGGTITTEAWISPTWSGSWRSTRSAWDRWWATGSTYGGRATLWQGDYYGSGPMKGLAVYGDQLVNLGATSITKLEVAVRSVGLSGGSPAVAVQGSPHGSQPAGAPSSSGDTASGMDTWLTLPTTTAESMRTGAAKGLCTVGASASACAGAGTGDGMTLHVVYTRPA